jgi:hypothetical protein
VDLVEAGWGDVDWICLAKDRGRWGELLWIGIEPSGSINCWEIIECPNNYGSLE